MGGRNCRGLPGLDVNDGNLFSVLVLETIAIRGVGVNWGRFGDLVCVRCRGHECRYDNTAESDACCR